MRRRRTALMGMNSTKRTLIAGPKNQTADFARPATGKECAKHINPAHTLFEVHLRELGLYFQPEYRFHELRKWRFDYLVTDAPPPTWRLAIEIEGATFTNGRHSRGAGMQKDMDKYNAATMMGYRVLRFSTTDILRGRAKAFLAEHLRQT